MTKELSLSHFSSAPLGEIRSTEQGWKDDYRSCYDKPKGFWLSVDGEHDWRSWCSSEMPSWLEGKTRYRIHVADWSRLLVLTDALDLDCFTERYGRDTPRYNQTYIDWPAVAEIHSGIVIAPYCWSRRMHHSWYYGWDCASGCIWNAEAIARVEEALEAA